jgi:AraC-like DNA-binding protein
MLEHAQKLRDRSEMLSDPLSQILDLLDARCVLTGGIVAKGDWLRRFPQPNALKIMAIAAGKCWLVMDSLPSPVSLATGDIILVNGKHPMILTSDPSLDVPQAIWGDIQVVTDIAPDRHDGDVVVIGGHVAIDDARQDLLLDVLPPLVHVGAAAPQAPTLGWLLDQVVRDSQIVQSGSAVTAALLAQLLFVQSLRATLSVPGSETRGWLRALADERLAPALQMIHADPARKWTLADLARGVAMSRTAFAVKFRYVAGVAPLTYLFNWRMRLAESSLRKSDVSVAQVAQQVGYTSESAFSNAFKRATGTSPKRFRDGFATPPPGQRVAHDD